jgi:hypothetical protein
MTTKTNQSGFFNSASSQLILLAAIVIAILLVAWRYVFWFTTCLGCWQLIRAIPLDVWAAASLAAAVFFISIFDPIQVIFVGVFLAACAYIAFKACGGKLP